MSKVVGDWFRVVLADGTGKTNVRSQILELSVTHFHTISHFPPALHLTLRSRTAPVSASSSGNGANAGARMLPIRVKTKPSRLSEIHAHVHEAAVSSWLTSNPAVAMVIRRAG